MIFALIAVLLCLKNQVQLPRAGSGT